jgi:hypothetical protein
VVANRDQQRSLIISTTHSVKASWLSISFDGLPLPLRVWLR